MICWLVALWQLAWPPLAIITGLIIFAMIAIPLGDWMKEHHPVVHRSVGIIGLLILLSVAIAGIGARLIAQHTKVCVIREAKAQPR